jgi:prophage regulatory protein
MFDTGLSSTDATSVLTADICFIRLRAVMRITGLGKTSIYRKSTDGSFPAPVKLGDRAVAWIKAEVLVWAEARVAERGL